MDLILLRYGEIALKGHNRHEFVRRLRRNVRACLKAHGIQGEVVSVGRRIYVRTARVADPGAASVREALEPLSRVFGLVSLSPAREVARDIEAIVGECVRQAKAAGVRPGVSYRVRARRADKTFPYISPEIDRLAGEAIHRACEGRVDLSKQAEVTIGVEVTPERALIYSQQVPGPGGLPVGVGGRVVALISGGIDSPVAAWMMMKRGCSVIPLHFSLSECDRQNALHSVQVLSGYSYDWELRPIMLDHQEVVGDTLRRLRIIGEERWSCIFCKRALLLKACQVASEMGAHGIVMGDSLGQVASQTLSNMEVISFAIPMPVLRPLIGLDKTEIVDLARRIGTFPVATRSGTACPFLPHRPVTRGSLEKLQQIARRLAEVEVPAQ